MTKDEKWVPLPRFDNLIEVSDMGRVRSMERTVKGRGIGLRTIPTRLVKFRGHPWGYYWCEFMLNGVKYWDFVHRLVLEGFKGPCPEGYYVLHFDNNPKNNIPSNLRYGTPSENSQDKWMHGTQSHGDGIWWRKVNSPDVMAIRDARQGGVKIKTLCEQYGLSEAQVSRIGTGSRWTTCDGPVGSKNKKTKFLSDDEKAVVLIDRRSGLSITKLAEKYEVSRNQIHCFIRRHGL
jgi:transposase-like protein